MNLNSKYFDRIRINRDGPSVESAAPALCEHPGCGMPGGYRAPKGRAREGEYFNYCLDHVREYNKSYNYFAGMPDTDIAEYQRSAAIGHRPTWNMGVNRAGVGPETRKYRDWSENLNDPFGLFGGSARGGAEEPRETRRPLKNLERRSFAALNLEGSEDAAEIKARYKELVKRLHPDANGGDRSSEDRLREIIQAYHYLKTAGFC